MGRLVAVRPNNELHMWQSALPPLRALLCWVSIYKHIRQATLHILLGIGQQVALFAFSTSVCAKSCDEQITQERARQIDQCALGCFRPAVQRSTAG